MNIGSLILWQSSEISVVFLRSFIGLIKVIISTFINIMTKLWHNYVLIAISDQTNILIAFVRNSSTFAYTIEPTNKIPLNLSLREQKHTYIFT